MAEKDYVMNCYKFEYEEGIIIDEDYDYILESIKEDMKHLADGLHDRLEYKISMIEITEIEYNKLEKIV